MRGETRADRLRLALKVLSESERRLQDRIDIQELAKVATDEA